MDVSRHRSEIQHFYQNQTILLTGSTGFLGKVILEKLLRACEGFEHIFLLLRAKKGRTPHERFESLIQSNCFANLDMSKLRHRITPIQGDCSKLDLALCEVDRARLRTHVTCIIHSAADVRFNNPLKEAAYINVRGVVELVRLAKEIAHLRSFVYVSTVFSNFPETVIKEAFYEPPMSAESLLVFIECVKEEFLTKITEKLLGDWPNTYVFTKAIAEHYLKTNASGLPVAIVRPGVVIFSYEEPNPGWVEGYQGASSMILASYLGLLHSANFDGANYTWSVPVDFVANHILAVACDVQNKNAANNNNHNNNDDDEKIPIYNYTGGANCISYNDFSRFLKLATRQTPSISSLWCYSLKFHKNYWLHKLRTFFQHTLIACVLDVAIYCAGQRPKYLKLNARLTAQMDAMRRIQAMQRDIRHENVERLWRRLGDVDKRLFNFDMGVVDWRTFCANCVHGGRLYLLKESPSTAKRAKLKYAFLCIANYVINTLIYGCGIPLFILTIGRVYKEIHRLLWVRWRVYF